MTHNDLRLDTLGALAIRGGTEDVAALNRQRRKLCVLAVLALAKRPMSRDALVALFWGEQEESRARHSLTEALSHIRRVLGRDALDVRLSDVSLGQAIRTQVDAIQFSDAAAAGDHQRVVTLYGGAFLDGIHLDDAPAFNDWADRERARFQSLFVRSATHECLALARTRRWDECASVAERWLEADPTSSDAALYRLNALKAGNDRPALLQTVREYERIRAMLRRDYEMEPDAAVTALVDEVARRLESMPPEAVLPSSETNVTSPATAVRSGLADLHAESVAAPVMPVDRRVLWAPSRYRRLIAMTACVALLAVVMFAYLRRDRAASPLPRSAGVGLTVLPFGLIGPDSSVAYLAEGLTEELNAALGTVQGVRVIAARGQLHGLDGRTRAEFARTVGAAAVVDGSVRAAEGRVRVTVRLVDAKTLEQLWSDTYERQDSNALVVEREIATSVVRAMTTRLGAKLGVVSARRAVDPITHDLYLRGRYFHNRSGVPALERAATYYRQAIDRDSAYAPAWSGLAGVYLTRFNWGYSYGETVTPARAFIERALALDPELSDAHVTYSQLLRDDWRWEDAARALERALALNPSDVVAHHALSHLYFALQRPGDALTEAKHAIALDPLNPRIGMHLCVSYVVARMYDEAMQACRRGIELDAGFPDSHAKLAWVQMRRGELGEARQELEREMNTAGRTPAYLIQLALLDAYAGRAGRARALADSLVTSTAPARLQYPLLALVYAKLGDRARVMAMLEAAVVSHSDEVEEIVVAPELDPFRNDSAYRDVVRRVGLGSNSRPH